MIVSVRSSLLILKREGAWLLDASRLLARASLRGHSAGIALPETMTKKRNFVAGFRTK
jgi:hypothetical protein